MNSEFFSFHSGYMQPCEITTYLGDRYYGLFVDAIDERKETYFIPFTKDGNQNLTFQRWREGEKENKTTNILKKYGILLPDKNFIVGFQTGSSNPQQAVGSTGSRSGNISTKKLFIIGAGASYGFSFDEASLEMRPPLVNEIFDSKYSNIYKQYPGVVKNISRLRFEKNIEKYFQDEWELLERSTSMNGLRDQINIQFYLYRLFNVITQTNDSHESNLYDQLVRYLDHYLRDNRNERVAIVSFNYDFLLEKAIERGNKIPFRTINDYVSDEHRINIFKPHGSANWGWKIEAISPITYGVPNSANSPLFADLPSWLYYHNRTLAQIYELMLGGYRSGYGKFLINKDDIALTKPQESVYPALFLPYINKDEFMMPYKHQILMESYLSSIEEICIIGWKGSEDEFNKSLKMRLASKKIKLTVVDPNHDLVLRNLDFIQIDGKPQVFKNFDEYCRNGIIIN